jgi:hypothetical protein
MIPFGFKNSALQLEAAVPGGKAVRGAPFPTRARIIGELKLNFNFKSPAFAHLARDSLPLYICATGMMARSARTAPMAVLAVMRSGSLRRSSLTQRRKL